MDELELELKICFLDEAGQLIEDAEQCFLTLESNKEDSSIIEKIFRLAHNLKGSSRAVGFNQMAEFTHVFESLLLKLKNKELEIEGSLVNLLLRCNDHLRNWVATLRSDLNASVDSQALIGELEAFIAGRAGKPSELPADIPKAEDLITSSPIVGEEDPVPAASAFSDDDNAFSVAPSAFASEIPKTAEPVKVDITNAAPVKSQAAPSPKANAAPAEDETVRVSLKRLEGLVNFVGELVILQTVLNQHRTLIASPLVNRTIAQLSKITKDIQDISMSLRMVPLRQTFQKMQRIVRDTSRALSKDVQFVISGEQTEIDKTVVEQLGDPLVHLVRNAVDHGIESNSEREANGKVRQGNISLSAFHRGGRIVIEVRDDGKGLDPEKLRKKAIEKGIIKENQVLSEKEALELIFAPGFSTKTEVTEVSGRGVGMDVVRTNIEKHLRGSIELESEVGKGSCVRILLPLTLAIIDGMVVTIDDERYVVPLNHVHESYQPQTKDIHFVTGLGDVLSLRGEELPLLRLSALLGRKSQNRPATESIAIIVRTSERPFSVLVDDIIGQQQIVIKQLGAEIRSIQGFSGSAILGDGRAALILDLNEMTNRQGSERRAS